MIVLLVEDSAPVVELWESMLARVGRIFRRADTIEAAQIEMEREPHPDLILLDLRLKGESSSPEQTLAAIEEFKRINPQVVVLVVTGNPDAKLPELAAAAGADGFAHKLSVAVQDRLFRAVKDAFAKGTEDLDPGKPYERRMELLERLNSLVT